MKSSSDYVYFTFVHLRTVEFTSIFPYIYIYIYICVCVCVCVCVRVCARTNIFIRAGCDTSSIFKNSLNSKLSFFLIGYHTSLLNYLPIAGGIIYGPIYFQEILGLCEM